MSSIPQYCKPKISSNNSCPSGPCLPDPGAETSEAGRRQVEVTNARVAEALVKKPGRKRSSTTYHRYEPEIKAKIGRYAAENGNVAAVNKFSKVLGYELHEATVRNFKRAYCEKLRVVKDPEAITKLDNRKLGRPTTLSTEMELALKEYIRKLRQNSAIVNRMIVISAAYGIVEYFNKGLLKEFGGTLELTRVWVQSFMSRIGLVKRKGTKAARKLPDDYPAIKLQYLERIKTMVTHYHIPHELIFNWDQTGIKMVPASEWTMAEEGSKQVEIRGLDDKREITVLLTVTLSGRLLPPQLIYAGKTKRCHPKQSFPDDWDIYHSPNHWSNEDTMLHYVQEIIIPYVSSTRQALGLPPTQEALACLLLTGLKVC